MNQNILNWLKLILKERFGIEFNIKKNDNNFIISNDEFKGSIIFDNLEEKFFQFNSNLSCEMWNPAQEKFQSITKQPLFAPTSKLLKLPIIDKKNQDYYIHYDILGLTFWHLNRLEEINNNNTDQFGRFDYKFSHAYTHGYHDQPIVDHWLDILSQVILKIWPKIKLKKNLFRMELSHDVDRPFLSYSGKNFHSYLRNFASSFYHNKLNTYGNLILSHINLINSNHQKDPYDNFDWLMDIAEKNKLKSTFNFLIGGTHIKDGYYSIENKKIKRLIKSINKKKHNIGIHLSFRCYNDYSLIENELKKFRSFLNQNNINLIEVSSRMHYLKLKLPDTLVYLSNAGVDRDTTLGYPKLGGFRCGTCFTFTGFDPIQNKILNIKITPLILMDTVLTSKKDFNIKQATELAIDLKYKCKQVDGIFSLLWHNCNLINESSKNLLKDILKG